MQIPKDSFISVEVRSRDKLFFSGEVAGLSSYDAKGQFDVLPHHSNLISVIKDKLILYSKEGGTMQEVAVENGVLQVVGGQVKVFLREK